MRLLPDSKHKKTPMRRKLFLYMLALAVIVLSFLAIGLFFLGNFSSTKAMVAKDLSFQLDVYERQIDKYYDDLTMMGAALSDDVSHIIEHYLSSNGIDFTDINDSLEHVTGIQSEVFGKLHEELLKTKCSGAFIIFNATVNTLIEDAQFSRTGVYFQRSTLDATDESILLYRGIADLGRKNGIMPHRKWRLEFRTDMIPGWNDLPETASVPVEGSACLLNALTLPGTSERALHFIVPINGTDGSAYGFCGFEISESYFKTYFAQSTQISHLSCLFTKKGTDKIDPTTGFSAGVFNGYYLPPNEELLTSDFGDGLVTLNGSSSFVGKTKEIRICNDEYILSVMIPKNEYNEMAAQHIIRMICLILLLLCVIVIVCVVFSRKYLSPLLQGLEQIRKHEHQTNSSDLMEIDDLFVFLTEQDKLHEEENRALLTECDRQKLALDKANNEIKRLSYARKTEVDPDDYEVFKVGIESLTKTEKAIFKLYLDGKTADEIQEICDIRQSTLKYHNHNILGKLGVSSRKQMLRYATLLRQETDDEL